MFKKLSVQRNTEAPSKPTGYFFKKRRFSFRPHVNGVFVHHNADSLLSFLLCVDERKRRFFNMKMSYISHSLLALRMLCKGSYQIRFVWTRVVESGETKFSFSRISRIHADGGLNFLRW